MTSQAKHTTLNLLPDLTQKARAKAIAKGSNLSAVVASFLRAWLAGEIDLPTQEAKAQTKRKRKDKPTG